MYPCYAFAKAITLRMAEKSASSEKTPPIIRRIVPPKNLLGLLSAKPKAPNANPMTEITRVTANIAKNPKPDARNVIILFSFLAVWNLVKTRSMLLTHCWWCFNGSYREQSHRRANHQGSGHQINDFYISNWLVVVNIEGLLERRGSVRHGNLLECFG